MTKDNLYDDDDSDSGTGWISWFCDLEGHEYFVEVVLLKQLDCDCLISLL